VRESVRSEKIAEFVVDDWNGNRNPIEECEANHDYAENECGQPKPLVLANLTKPELDPLKQHWPISNQRDGKQNHDGPKQQLEPEQSQPRVVVGGVQQAWQQPQHLIGSH
jgi:hypothetical protein